MKTIRSLFFIAWLSAERCRAMVDADGPRGWLILYFCVCLLVGCATNGPDATKNTRNAKINATASFVAQKVATVAFQTILSAAVSQSDSQARSNYLDGLAAGFRTQEGNLLTSNDVQSLVSIWTPQAPHWSQLGVQLADTYTKANPKTPAEAKAVLEAIAQGLNSTNSVP